MKAQGARSLARNEVLTSSGHSKKGRDNTEADAKDPPPQTRGRSLICC